MGHSSIDVTVDIYGHLVPGGNRQAVDRLDDQNGNKMETFQEPAGETERQPEPELFEKIAQSVGATRRTRTGDLLITNQLLYQLS